MPFDLYHLAGEGNIHLFLHPSGTGSAGINHIAGMAAGKISRFYLTQLPQYAPHHLIARSFLPLAVYQAQLKNFVACTAILIPGRSISKELNHTSAKGQRAVYLPANILLVRLSHNFIKAQRLDKIPQLAVILPADVRSRFKIRQVAILHPRLRTVPIQRVMVIGQVGHIHLSGIALKIFPVRYAIQLLFAGIRRVQINNRHFFSAERLISFCKQAQARQIIDSWFIAQDGSPQSGMRHIVRNGVLQRPVAIHRRVGGLCIKGKKPQSVFTALVQRLLGIFMARADVKIDKVQPEVLEPPAAFVRKHLRKRHTPSADYDFFTALFQNLLHKNSPFKFKSND